MMTFEECAGVCDVNICSPPLSSWPWDARLLAQALLTHLGGFPFSFILSFSPLLSLCLFSLLLSVSPRIRAEIHTQFNTRAHTDTQTDLKGVWSHRIYENRCFTSHSWKVHLSCSPNPPPPPPPFLLPSLNSTVWSRSASWNYMSPSKC